MRRKAVKKQNRSFSLKTLSHRNKIILIGVIFFAILVIWLFVDRGFQVKKLNQAKRARQQLVQELELNKKKVADSKQITEQLETLSAQYNQMLKMLPPESEVHKALKEVTKIGVSEELKFVLFKPGVDQEYEFYNVTPIQVAVLGDYHHAAGFVSQLANLSELVTIRDFSLARENEAQNLLVMRMTLYVYSRNSRSGGG